MKTNISVKICVITSCSERYSAAGKLIICLNKHEQIKVNGVMNAQDKITGRTIQWNSISQTKNRYQQHLAGRLLSARPCITCRRTSWNRHLGTAALAVYQGSLQRFLYDFAHKMRTEQTPCLCKQAGWRYVFSARKTDGRAWGCDRTAQSRQSNRVGCSDE